MNEYALLPTPYHQCREGYGAIPNSQAVRLQHLRHTWEQVMHINECLHLYKMHNRININHQV